jgi:hypothetical protein
VPALKSALHAFVAVRFSDEAPKLLEALQSRVHLTGYRPSGDVRMEITVGRDRQRLDLLERDKAKASFIRGAEDHSTFLDHSLSAWVAFPGEGIPRSTLKPVPVSAPEILRQGARTRVTLTLSETELGEVRQELVFDDDERVREFGPALFSLVHAGLVNIADSRYPIEKLLGLGCLAEERVWVGGLASPLMELRLTGVERIEVPEASFAPPPNYRPLVEVLARPVKPSLVPAAREPRTRPAERKPEPEAVASKPSRTRLLERALSPDCLGGTRLGALSALIHQDLLDHTTSLLNTAAPLLGSATLAGTPPAAGNPMAYVGDGLRVVYRGTNGHVYELTFRPADGKWHAFDMMTIAGTPLAAGDPMGYFAGTPRVVYRDVNGHIQEFSIDPPTGLWQAFDMMGIPGAPPAVGDPTGYDGGTPRVVYRGAGGRIHELSIDLGTGVWQAMDMMSATGAPLAAGEPTGYFGQTPRVVYRASNDHLWELSIDVPTGVWQAFDMAAIPNAPLAMGDPHGYFEQTPRVVYRGANASIHELSIDGASGVWQAMDMIVATGAPAPADEPRGYSGGGTPRVVYRDRQDHIQELWLDSTGWQAYDMTTVPNARAMAGAPAGCADSVPHVVYRDSNGRVFMLSIEASSGWVVTDISDFEGVLTLPWLAGLTAAVGGLASAPGAGLLAALRDPRVPSTSPSGPSGGKGLIDRVAVKTLRAKDERTGLAFLQREFQAQTLDDTLRSWGVPPAVATRLDAVSGDWEALSDDDRIDIVEAYETSQLTTLTLRGLPAALPSATDWWNWENLVEARVSGISGAMDFASLAGGPLVTRLAIGAAGNVFLDLTLPTTTLSASLARRLTSDGGLVLGGVTVAACIVFPFACVTAVVVSSLLGFVLNNVTNVTVGLTGMMLAIEIQYRWNPQTRRLDPFVSATATGGAVTVTNTWSTPNIVANLFESFLLGVGTLFGVWPGVFGLVVGGVLEGEFRKRGLTLPSGTSPEEMEATFGEAWSEPRRVLVLSIDVGPATGVAAQPFITQAATRDTVFHQLDSAHLRMHQDLNPQPLGAPGPGSVTSVANYFALAANQNALAYSLFTRWRQGMYTAPPITDPGLIARLVRLAPGGLFARSPERIVLWAAAPPRIETSIEGIVHGTGPLSVSFDDVRACFQLSRGNNEGYAGTWELSFALAARATVEPAWPTLLRFAFYLPVAATELRSWEFADPNAPRVMTTVDPAHFEPMVKDLAHLFLSRFEAQPGPGPSGPPSWSRPLPDVTAGILEEVDPLGGMASLYLEILGRRRALYLLPALRTHLLELVDGSGMPNLGLAIGAPAGALSLRTLNRAQGLALRAWLGLMGRDSLVP